jgi:hypothetical protein
MLADWSQDEADGGRVSDEGGKQFLSWRRPEPWLFYFLVILHLVPVWSVRYFPSHDGVGHVENAVILQHWLGRAGDFYRQYYRLNPFPEPNYTGHILLAMLTLALSPANALKAIVSLFILTFPSAVRYAAGSIRRGGEVAAYLALPFVFGLPLQKGNFNFCFGLVLFFVVIGFWISHRERLRLRSKSGLRKGAGVQIGSLCWCCAD